MKRAWDIQTDENWWISLGFHIDHTDPSLTLHLPGGIICFGRCKQPGFKWSLRRQGVESVKEAWHLVPGLCIAMGIIILSGLGVWGYWQFGANDLIKLLLLPGWIAIAAITMRPGSLYDVSRKL